MINAEKEAQRVLKNVWCNRHFPVDSYIIATQFGIKVIETTLPKDVAGAIIKKKGSDPIIALNKTDSVNRKRFSCAHELGHYVFRASQLQEEYDYIDLRSKISRLGTEPEEIFANKFAAALLMPEEYVKRLRKEKMPFFLIAQYFGVSDDSIAFRVNYMD